MQNHFELFQLPQQFVLDNAALDAAYLEVQGRVHPDKFVNASDAEKRVAMQWSTLANEAYQTLKNPLKRAAYLCELNGADLNVDTNTAMPSAFLVQQMEWREALDEARAEKNIAALEELEADLRSVCSKQKRQLVKLLDAQDFENAVQRVREWMFLEKFGDELRAAFDMLEN
jgi:molecular chaperone HscB